MSITPDFTFEVHGLVVVFRGTSTGDPVSTWTWDFGSSYRYQNVTHKFLTPGLVDVTLTVQDNYLVPYYVTKQVNVLYDTRFRCNPSNDNPLKIQFFDSSDPIGLTCQWSWDFGDGETSNAHEPEHTYASEGTYDVTFSTLNGSWVGKVDVGNASSIVLALVNDGHIIKSEDDGQVWVDQGLKVSPYGESSNGMETACGLINFGGGIIVAFTGHNYIERSVDYGDTWTQIPIDYLINHVQVARSGISLGCGRGILGGFHWVPTCLNMILGSVLVTTDYGETWICKTSTYNYGTYLDFKSFANNSIIVSLKATLLSSCGSSSDSKTQLAVSTDYGDTWTDYGPSPLIAYSTSTPDSLLELMLPNGSVVTPQTLLAQMLYAQSYGAPPLSLATGLILERMFWSSNGKLFAASNSFVDSMVWTLRSIGIVSYWYRVAYGNGRFVAVAHTGGVSIAVSVDGISWTPVPDPGAGFREIAYGDSSFMAFAPTHPFITSIDGEYWLQTLNEPTRDTLMKIVFGNHLFVVYGTASVLFPTSASVDGVVWAESAQLYNAKDIYILFAEDKFYRFMNDGNIYTSTDGVNWSAPISNYLSSFPDLKYVAYGNGVFVAMPNLTEPETTIYISSDAITWSPVDLPEFCVWTNIRYCGGLFIILSDGYKINGMATSPDGRHWTMRMLPASSFNMWQDVAYDGSSFVSIGVMGTYRAMTSPGPVVISSAEPVLHMSSDRGESYEESLAGIEVWSFSENGTWAPPTPTVGILANTNIITYQDKDVGFSSMEPVAGRNINNCLLKNFGGLMHLNHLPEDVFSCILNENPEFTSVVIDHKIDHINEVMSKDFKPKKTTPCFDMGDNSFVTDVPTDVLGNDRIYDDGFVDIGPYELTILNVVLKSGDIQSIFQEKLEWDEDNSRFLPRYGDAIYNDIAAKMADDTQEEFAREAKIVIVLKKLRVDYKTRTDKMNDSLITVEAYYDNATQSIVCYKFHDKIGDMLSKFFEDDRYVVYFNEALNELTFYLNKTYDKGLSGHRNAVKNVRFGGSPVFIG